MELIAVMAMVAVLSTVILGGLSAGSRAASVGSAQVTLANLLVATRTRAMANGRNARLLVHISPHSEMAGERYLRYVVVQVQEPTGWSAIDHVSLPRGVYLVPRDPAALAGLLDEPVRWRRPSDGGLLRSSALRPVGSSFPDAEISVALNSAVIETWATITFTATGATVNSGDLVLAMGQRLPPGSEFPIRLESPEAVRGVALSSYGVITLIDERDSF